MQLGKRRGSRWAEKQGQRPGSAQDGENPGRVRCSGRLKACEPVEGLGHPGAAVSGWCAGSEGHGGVGGTRTIQGKAGAPMDTGLRVLPTPLSRG